MAAFRYLPLPFPFDDCGGKKSLRTQRQRTPQNLLNKVTEVMERTVHNCFTVNTLEGFSEADGSPFFRQKSRDSQGEIGQFPMIFSRKNS